MQLKFYFVTKRVLNAVFSNAASNTMGSIVRAA